MFTVERTGPDRVDISMSGRMDLEAMKAALERLVVETEGITKGRMLYDVIDYKLPTFDAIVHEFSRLPEMLPLMKRFSRAAVLTDKAWLKTASELEGLLFPGLEIKAFRRDERQEAEAWLEAKETTI